MNSLSIVCWRVFDFKNQRGDNEVHNWAREQGALLKARLNALIRHLEALDRPVLTRADGVGLLRKAGPCHGHKFIELTITIGKVEYRPIGWYGPGPRVITLLMGAKEKGGDLEPRNACIRAINNKKLVLTDPGRYTVDHDFS